MTKAAEAYPLYWPEGWPRKKDYQRNSSRYELDFARARDELLRELRLIGARDVVLSSNVPLRRDGLPLASTSEPSDPGVAVYWTDRKGRPRVIACDVWRRVRENLRAVGLAIESLRALERTGASELLERAFAGFARLPEGPDHWGVLGVSRGSSKPQIDARFRELARQHHPDRGGDPSVMATITAAYHAVLGEVGA